VRQVELAFVEQLTLIAKWSRHILGSSPDKPAQLFIWDFHPKYMGMPMMATAAQAPAVGGPPQVGVPDEELGNELRDDTLQFLFDAVDAIHLPF
jgi:hypothetical protein